MPEKNAGKKIMGDQSLLSPLSFRFGYEQMRREEKLIQREKHMVENNSRPQYTQPLVPVEMSLHILKDRGSAELPILSGYFVTKHSLKRKLVKSDHMIVCFFGNLRSETHVRKPMEISVLQVNIMGLWKCVSIHQGAERNPLIGQRSLDLNFDFE